MIFKKYTLLLAAALIYAQSPCLARDLEQAANNLSVEQPFQFFDAGISDEDKQTLAKMKVTENHHSHRFSFYKDCADLHFAAAACALDVSKSEKEKIASIFQKTCKNIAKNLPNNKIFAGGLLKMKNYEMEKFEPDHDWHVDLRSKILSGKEDGSDRLNQRIIVNLKGPGTKFIDLDSSEQAEFAACCRNWSKYNAKNEQALQLKQGHGALFDQYYAIHSRPDNKNSRAFMLIDIRENEQAEVDQY